MEYRISEDLDTLRAILECSKADLASALDVGPATIGRWLANTVAPSRSKIERFYSYAFERGVFFNQIKAQLHKEDAAAKGLTTLFHGSKTGIVEPLSLDKSCLPNDFGRGFYCGESLEQSATFVAGFPNSSLYVLSFDPSHLSCASFVVNQDWMLAIAWYRGWLRDYADHPRIIDLVHSVESAYYVVAPIADNRMYEVVNSFVDGIITDVQCQHSLAATGLGNQYVFTTERALRHVRLQEQCYLCSRERASLLARKKQENQTGANKAKTAIRKYRNEGHYIEELLS